MTLEQWFLGVLARYPRVGLVGGSGTGKSTLSIVCQDRPVLHSDDFKHLDWSAASEEMARKANEQPGPVLVEGVAVARALRKGMRVDAVVLLKRPRRVQSRGQVVQEKGIYTVLAEWQKANPTAPVLIPPKEVYAPVA